jgi:copper chaperone CopZ
MTFGMSAQTSIKTQTFTVKGNCDECKGRIENAADIKGVKFTEWNPDTKIAKVTFDTLKTTLPTIQAAIAARGYDAGEIKASDKSYRRLPTCCKYRDGDCEEKKK